MPDNISFMKNLLKFFLLINFFSSNAFGQWINEEVNDGIEAPYHICYNYSDGLSGNAFLAKLENVNGAISFYVASTEFCYDYDFAVVYFTLNGKLKDHVLNGHISKDGQAIFLTDNLTTSKILSDFKAASEMRIDLFYESCPHSIANFDMKGSTAAYNFIKKK